MDEEPKADWPNFDEFIANLARIFVHRGNAAAVAVLSEGSARAYYKETGIRYNPSYEEYDVFDAWLSVPQAVFNSIIDRIPDLEKELREQAQVLLRTEPGIFLENFIIGLENVNDPDWRLKAKAWLRGEGVNNQGRVRSDNPAPYEKDGLLFRSKPEINLYYALKGVSERSSSSNVITPEVNTVQPTRLTRTVASSDHRYGQYHTDTGFWY